MAILSRILEARGAYVPCPLAPMPAHRFSIAALIGLAAWVALLFAPLGTDGGAAAELAARLLLLAILATVPLLLDAVADPLGRDAAPLRWASRAVGAAGLLAAVSFLLPAGPQAGALTLPWLGATALVGAEGLRRAWAQWRARRWIPEEALLAVGLAALPGGAVWLALSRTGLDPGPYGAFVVLLTAVHFHYATFVAPVWGGLLGRVLRARMPRAMGAFTAAAAALVVGTPLTAVGIAVSRTPAGGTPVEAAGVLGVTLGAIGLGALGLVVAGRLDGLWGRLFVGVSGGALALAMGLALWFHAGGALGVAAPDAVWMVPRHGWLNAVGFGLWGALGWRRLRPRAAA